MSDSDTPMPTTRGGGKQRVKKGGGPRPNRQYPRTGKRGAPQAFPRKVFEILSEQPRDIISWNAGGRTFSIHDMGRFVSQVLQKYFAHQKFSSFQRQLNLYGYRRTEPGGDEPAGAYFHVSFREGCEDLVGEVRRTPQSHRSGRGGGHRGGGGGGAYAGGSARVAGRKRKARARARDDSDDDSVGSWGASRGGAEDGGDERDDGDDSDDASATKLRRTTRVAARAVRSRVRELARQDAEPDDDDDDESESERDDGDDAAEMSDGAAASGNVGRGDAPAAEPKQPAPHHHAGAAPSSVVELPPARLAPTWAPPTVHVKPEVGDGVPAPLARPHFPARLGSIGDGSLLVRTASISSEGWDFGALKAEDFEEHLRQSRDAANLHPTGGAAVDDKGGRGAATAVAPLPGACAFDVSVDGVTIQRSFSSALPLSGDLSCALPAPAALLRQPSWASAASAMPFAV